MLKDTKDKLFENPFNRTCFDCSEKDPDWASVNNSVLLCKECQVKHRSYGVSISYIRSIDLDVWKEEQIALLKLGGHERLRDLLSIYNIKFNIDRNELYFSKLMDYYRKLLKAELRGENRPQPPSDEDALKPIDEDRQFNCITNQLGEINIKSEKQEEIENVEPAGSYLGGYVGTIWNKTKDIASVVKNKVDESGITEVVAAKTSYITSKVVESSATITSKVKETTSTLTEKGSELAKKGMDYAYVGVDYTKSKVEEVVSNNLNF